jgi:hypothetical protein
VRVPELLNMLSGYCKVKTTIFSLIEFIAHSCIYLPLLTLRYIDSEF